MNKECPCQGSGRMLVFTPVTKGRNLQTVRLYCSLMEFESVRSNLGRKRVLLDSHLIFYGTEEVPCDKCFGHEGDITLIQETPEACSGVTATND